MRTADHSSKRSNSSRCSDKSSVHRTEVLSRIKDLISIVRAQEVSVAERTRTVTSHMDKLGGGYKINLPATMCQTVAIVHVFVPGRIKMFVKLARFLVCLTPYHHGGGGDLVDASGSRLQRRNGQMLNPNVFENERARRWEGPRQVFLANVSTGRSRAGILVHELFKKLNGSRENLNIRIENQNIRRRCPSEGLVHTARKPAIFVEPYHICTIAKLYSAVQ